MSLSGWLRRDDRVCGIVALGSVTESEFTEAFERWPTVLRAIEISNVRAEVYRVLHPSKIALVPNGRRYQSISFSVGPRRFKSMGSEDIRSTRCALSIVEPMPFLF